MSKTQKNRPNNNRRKFPIIRYSVYGVSAAIIYLVVREKILADNVLGLDMTMKEKVALNLITFVGALAFTIVEEIVRAKITKEIKKRKQRTEHAEYMAQEQMNFNTREHSPLGYAPEDDFLDQPIGYDQPMGYEQHTQQYNPQQQQTYENNQQQHFNHMQQPNEQYNQFEYAENREENPEVEIVSGQELLLESVENELMEEYDMQVHQNQQNYMQPNVNQYPEEQYQRDFKHISNQIPQEMMVEWREDEDTFLSEVQKTMSEYDRELRELELRVEKIKSNQIELEKTKHSKIEREGVDLFAHSYLAEDDKIPEITQESFNKVNETKSNEVVLSQEEYNALLNGHMPMTNTMPSVNSINQEVERVEQESIEDKIARLEMEEQELINNLNKLEERKSREIEIETLPETRKKAILPIDKTEQIQEEIQTIETEELPTYEIPIEQHRNPIENGLKVSVERVGSGYARPKEQQSTEIKVDMGQLVATHTNKTQSKEIQEQTMEEIEEIINNTPKAPENYSLDDVRELLGGEDLENLGISGNANVNYEIIEEEEEMDYSQFIDKSESNQQVNSVFEGLI